MEYYARIAINYYGTKIGLDEGERLIGSILKMRKYLVKAIWKQM